MLLNEGACIVEDSTVQDEHLRLGLLYQESSLSIGMELITTE